jgi:hypothetical protein
MKTDELISDEKIESVWGNADFGNVSKRDVIKGALLKCASGYYTGFTAKLIVIQLGLVYPTKWALTPLGKKYLFAAYSNGVSI